MTHNLLCSYTPTKQKAVFTFLHLASNPGLIGVLLAKKIIGLAYETLQKDGSLPILTPMSEIAGSNDGGTYEHQTVIYVSNTALI